VRAAAACVSGSTTRRVDLAIRAPADSAMNKGKQILTRGRSELERGAKLLLDKVTLADQDPEAPIGEPHGFGDCEQSEPLGAEAAPPLIRDAR